MVAAFRERRDRALENVALRQQLLGDLINLKLSLKSQHINELQLPYQQLIAEAPQFDYPGNTFGGLATFDDRSTALQADVVSFLSSVRGPAVCSRTGS